jgi:hypothetical protein
LKLTIQYAIVEKLFFGNLSCVTKSVIILFINIRCPFKIERSTLEVTKLGVLKMERLKVETPFGCFFSKLMHGWNFTPMK